MINEVKDNTRNISLDVLRVIACFLVVLYHARELNTIPSSNRSVEFFNTATNFGAFFMGRLGVPLFLLISGYFSFSKELETFSFLKKRLSRIVPPFVFWLLLCTLIIGGTKGFMNNLWTLSCAGHLWYIYALVGCLLLVPIINPFLQKASKQELLFLLGIWGVTLIFNGNYFESLKVYTLDNQGMVPKNPFFAIIPFYGYFGYFILGYIASKYEFKRFFALILIVVSIALWLLSAYFTHKEIHSAWFYLSLPVVMMSFGVLLLFKGFKFDGMSPKWGGIIIKISNLSFGVYLLHGLVLFALNQFDCMHGINTFAIGLCVFFLSLFFTYVISKLPFNKYIIG